MKFHRRFHRGGCRRFDQRKRRVRELLPDGKIFRRNREPPNLNMYRPGSVTPRLAAMILLTANHYFPFSILSAGGQLCRQRIRSSKARRCKANVASATDCSLSGPRSRAIPGAGMPMRRPPARAGGDFDANISSGGDRRGPDCACSVRPSTRAIAARSRAALPQNSVTSTRLPSGKFDRIMVTIRTSGSIAPNFPTRNRSFWSRSTGCRI